MKGSKAMDALRVFPGSKMRRAGMPISRDDARYQTLVRGFNLRWVGNPRFVQVVEDAQQVRETVQSAVSAHMRITLRGGGHCYLDGALKQESTLTKDIRVLK